MLQHTTNQSEKATMDDAIAEALTRGHTVDITTTGRRSGEPRRLEIVFHNFDGRIFISGVPSPRKRSWIANLEANPSFTFHLKGPGPSADLAATARVITDDAERREILPKVAQVWGRRDIDAMIAMSPLIEVTLDAGVA
jgi:deazaflavin-dependent oxidoreductase (nitroreductase family)